MHTCVTLSDSTWFSFSACGHPAFQFQGVLVLNLLGRGLFDTLQTGYPPCLPVGGEAPFPSPHFLVVAQWLPARGATAVGGPLFVPTHFSSFLLSLFPSFPGQMWEEITVTEEDENGKQISSVIKVPAQVCVCVCVCPLCTDPGSCEGLATPFGVVVDSVV